MSRIRPGRLVIALLIALSSVGVLVVPASAATPITVCNGNCGYYEIGDNGPPYGANCQYEKVSYALDKMSVRPPLMHGPYTNKTKVRWLFRIFRMPSGGGAWSQIYQSSWQNAMASDSIPARAGSGFSRRTWTAPENPAGFYKVRILMHWFNSAGNRVGISAWELDNYKSLWNGNVRYDTEHCLQSW